MKAITGSTGSALTWTKPKFSKRRYELREHGELVATVDWESWLGSTAVATTTDGSWTLRRRGFMGSRVTIERPGSDAEVARLDRQWTGAGTLHAPSGARIEWTKLSFWRAEWCFVDAIGRRLVRFHPGFLLRHAEVAIEPDARAHPDLSLLLVLGWYLIVLKTNNDAPVAAAGS